MCPAAFSAAMNFMSWAGNFRMWYHMVYGQWVSFAHAAAYVRQACGS